MRIWSEPLLVANTTFLEISSRLIWSLTTPSAKLWGWPPQGSTYCMHRCWRLSAAPGTLRWISPANSVGNLMWTESKPGQTGHSDLWTKSPQIWEIAYQSLVHSQLEYASSVPDLYTKDRTLNWLHQNEWCHFIAVSVELADPWREKICGRPLPLL